jgi:hypothetical protein
MKYLVAFILMFWTVFTWADDASVVRVTRADGNVEILKPGTENWVKVSDGDILTRGDRLATRSRSAANLTWSNGSMVRVYPNTEIALTGVIFDLEKKIEKTYLDIINGRLFVKAQVPEHLFSEFKVRMGAMDVRTQGSEFAIKYDSEKSSFTAWSLIGRLVTDVGSTRLRVDDGQQAEVVKGSTMSQQDVVMMEEKIRESLIKASTVLGGSLFVEEVLGSAGGQLVARIGGVRNRRGDAPYKVNFKALTGGGSGKITGVTWNFGDGESSTEKAVEHTFTQGLYIVTLRVEDENGQKASAQVGISVEQECGC